MLSRFPSLRSALSATLTAPTQLLSGISPPGRKTGFGWGRAGRESVALPLVAVHCKEGKLWFAIMVLMGVNWAQVRTATITSKGQITIPKALCQRLGLQRGDTIDIWIEKGSIVFRPVKRKATLPTS